MHLVFKSALLLSFLPTPFAAAKSKFRVDLQKKLSPVICQSHLPTHPLDTWALKIFESQITGLKFRPYKGKRINKDFLSYQSKRLAYKSKNHSRVWGICKDGTGWVATLPSSQPLVYDDHEESYTFNLKNLKKNCRHVRADFAAASGGQPLQLPIPHKKQTFITFQTKLLDPGTLTVTCQPNIPKWQGPTMWYMVPVKGGPIADVPFTNLLSSNKTQEQILLDWINRIRQKEGLMPTLKAVKPMMRAAKTLSVSNSIIHNRNISTDTRTVLNKHGYSLLGENRVKGQSIREMTWLLWNSPRHRSLILNKQATHVGVFLNQHKKEHLAIITLGKSSSPNKL